MALPNYWAQNSKKKFEKKKKIIGGRILVFYLSKNEGMSLGAFAELS